MTESDRPLVTFALFAYNQERFIRETADNLDVHQLKEGTNRLGQFHRRV